MEAYSFSDLIESAVNLNSQEYRQFISTVNTRRAQYNPTVLTKSESDLLKKIYYSFSEKKQARINHLNAKIWDATLLESEHIELMQLIEEKEKWAAKRMQNIAKLATIRNTDYHSLIKQLGILPTQLHE